MKIDGWPGVGGGDMFGAVVDGLGAIDGTEDGVTGRAGRDVSAGLTCDIPCDGGILSSPIGKLDGKDGLLGGLCILLEID